MTAHIAAVAFQGIEVLPIDVQCQLSNGLSELAVVSFPDKTVAESRERVRAALQALGFSWLQFGIISDLG
jgi:magnesium chelatase family protein